MTRPTRSCTSAKKAAKKPSIKTPSAKKASIKKPSAKKPSKKPSGAAPKGSNKERTLQALASQFSFGHEKADRNAIITEAQIASPKSFANMLPDLKREGLVDYDSKLIWLTEAGKDHVGEDALSAPKDNGPMQEKIRSGMLKGNKAKDIFDFLLDGKWYTRPEIAEEMGLEKNKSFANAVGSLSKITEKQGGKIRLVDMCFPAGRPGEEEDDA